MVFVAGNFQGWGDSWFSFFSSGALLILEAECFTMHKHVSTGAVKLWEEILGENYFLFSLIFYILVIFKLKKCFVRSKYTKD